MIAGLVMHWLVLAFKIPFPGYDHDGPAVAPSKELILPTSASKSAPSETTHLIPPKNPPTNLVVQHPQHQIVASASEVSTSSTTGTSTPIWMYFFLAIPSVFDLAATAFCMMGLVYLDVSIYQLLRGSGIIFVALMKQHVLGDHLYKFQWVGVLWNVVSVILVGATAILNSSDEDQGRDVTTAQALLGVMLVLVGAFVQALQFVFEEKVMAMEDENNSVPPLLLIGMEGLWGTVLCLLVAYPLAYFIPGDDHGSYEDPFNTWHMITHTPTIRYAFAVYFFAIFGYNLFAVLLTFLLNSVWHAILDNFRPITIWGKYKRWHGIFWW